MLRKDIIIAVDRILDSIEKSGVFLIMESSVRRENEQPKEAILSSYQHYMHETKSYSEVENNLITIFKLEMLQDPGFWAVLLTGDDGPAHRPIAIEAFQSLRFIKEHLPKILLLLKRSSDEIIELPESSRHELNEDILTAILIEDEDASSAKRLIIALEAIEGLYDAISQIQDIDSQPLSVVSCDSGSDKSFDFLGSAKAIAGVKSTIISFWDKTVYFRENKSSKQLDVIAKSLPILTELSEMKEKGSIEPEKAELLKRQIFSSIEKFSDAGIIIPEIEEHTTFNPRQLMRPQQKLLIAPLHHLTDKTEKDAPSTDVNDQEINDPEFEKYMEAMAKKFLKKHGNNDDEANK